jgi:hypothetical protein
MMRILSSSSLSESGTCVHDQEHLNALHHADRLPSQLVVDFAVGVRDMAGIGEDQGCGFKTDAVLSPVDSILSFVATEPQVGSVP